MEQTAYSYISKLKLFNIFLIKHKAFYQFYYNMLMKHKSLERALIAMKMAYPYDYLMKAFYWGGTKEGGDFWTQLNAQWTTHLKKNYGYENF